MIEAPGGNNGSVVFVLGINVMLILRELCGLRSFGVPCQAWSVYFFVTLPNTLGSYICVKENTFSGKKLYVARVLIRIPLNFCLKERITLVIDGESFGIRLREDSFGPLRIINKQYASTRNNVSSYNFEDSWSISEGSSNGEDDNRCSEDSNPKDVELNQDFRKRDMHEESHHVFSIVEEMDSEENRGKKIILSKISSSFDEVV